MSKRFNLGNSAVHILPALFFLIPYISSAPISHSQTYEQFMNYAASKNCVIPGITNIFINCSSWNCLSFPLKECNTVEALNPKDEAFMLCHEIFENLEFIACQTNNTVMLTAENFHFSTEVCKDFANIAPAIPKRENYLGRRLEDEVVCNIICADKFEYLCKTLLWSYEIRNLMEDYLQKLKNVEKKLDIDEQREVDQEKKFDSNRQSEVNNEHANGILESKDKLLQSKQENDQKLPQSDDLQEVGQSALLQSGENNLKFSESSNPDFHLKGEAEYSKDKKHNDLNFKKEEMQHYNGKENKAKSEPNQLSHETKSQRFEAGNSSGKEILGSNDKLTYDVGLLDGAVSYKKNKEQMLDDESKNINSNLEVVDIKQNEITDDGSVKPSQNGKSGIAKVVKSTSEQIHDKPSESKGNEVLDVTSKPKEASHKPISVVPNQLVSNEKKVESDQHQDEAKLPVTQNDSVKMSSKDQTTGGKSQGKKVDSNLLTVNTQPGIATNASLQGEKDIQNNSISSSLAFENTLKPDSSTLEAPLEKMEDGNVPQNMNKDQDQYNDIENDDDNEQGEYSKPDYDGALYHSTKSKDIDLEAPNSIDLPPSEITMEKSENPKSIDKFSSRNSFGRGPDDIQMISSFPEQEDSHFFFYFLSIVLILMAGYLIFHNKQKIIALIVEGRHERRRRSHGVGYKKLETK